MLPLRPYLFRAIFDWTLENNLTPHMVVDAKQDGVDVPAGFVRDGQITLNIHPSAVRNFTATNDGVEFSARFNGEAFFVSVPMRAVSAVFAKENGRGMFFQDEPLDTPPPGDTPLRAAAVGNNRLPGRKRPALKLVK